MIGRLLFALALSLPAGLSPAAIDPTKHRLLDELRRAGESHDREDPSWHAGNEELLETIESLEARIRTMEENLKTLEAELAQARADVESARWVFVVGQVHKPGVYLLKKGLTARLAIADAGGLASDGAPNQTKVFRPMASGVEEHKLDVTDEGRGFELEAGDLVFVPLSLGVP